MLAITSTELCELVPFSFITACHARYNGAHVLEDEVWMEGKSLCLVRSGSSSSTLHCSGSKVAAKQLNGEAIDCVLCVLCAIDCGRSPLPLSTAC